MRSVFIFGLSTDQVH